MKQRKMSYMGKLADQDRYETELACKTLSKTPSKEALDFYAEIGAKLELESANTALNKLSAILDAYQAKDREFPTYNELRAICNEGMKSGS